MKVKNSSSQLLGIYTFSCSAYSYVYLIQILIKSFLNLTIAWENELTVKMIAVNVNWGTLVNHVTHENHAVLKSHR
jgi:hypothetical protein